MNEKSPVPACFYRPIDPTGPGVETFESLPATAGPWSPDAQHGGPPAALLTRAVEAAVPGVIGRLTVELLGPVPLGPLSVSASVLRPGRSVQLVGAELYDDGRGRPVASARAWVFPDVTDGPAQDPVPLPHTFRDGSARARPSGWLGGYLDAIQWRWVSGALDERGAGVVWMRPPDLVEGEPISPLQRLLACVDSASGASAALDVGEWAFLNTELTVHVLRPPTGDWICLDAETTLGPGSVGVAGSSAYDELGLVARSSQALLVARRP